MVVESARIDDQIDRERSDQREPEAPAEFLPISD
jgi:hypothetical protein